MEGLGLFLAGDRGGWGYPCLCSWTLAAAYCSEAMAEGLVLLASASSTIRWGGGVHVGVGRAA